MDDIKGTIRQYRYSCRLVEQRLGELDRIIAGYRAGTVPNDLYMRRMVLYVELGEMTGAIRELEEYLAQRVRQGQFCS